MAMTTRHHWQTRRREYCGNPMIHLHTRVHAASGSRKVRILDHGQLHSKIYKNKRIVWVIPCLGGSIHCGFLSVCWRWRVSDSRRKRLQKLLPTRSTNKGWRNCDGEI